MKTEQDTTFCWSGRTGSAGGGDIAKGLISGVSETKCIINKYYIHESMSNTGIGSIFMQKGEKHVYFH
ncbi:hypothetical protein [Listeria booriae]|uniref:hypothetical protein n=1 Tax=Listeria booriae TaxID=1552123 RepID=UPI00162AB9CF|nr:hypothetical protein [Listeria booriae]